MRCAPAAVPQVVVSPVVLRSTVLGCELSSVELELDDDLDLIAFLIYVPGSWL